MTGGAILGSPADFAYAGYSLDAIPAWTQAASTLDAIRLTQLGARAGLVTQFTGIDKALANRLYRQIHGRPSPPGQTPFTDHWFLKSDRRMLHAAVIWQLHGTIGRCTNSAAQRLIRLYEVYRLSVSEPLLDFAHAAFVPSLIDMGLWHEDQCVRCAAHYILPIEDRDTLCPGCRLHQRFRCPACGHRAEGLRKGRRPNRCRHCGQERVT